MHGEVTHKGALFLDFSLSIYLLRYFMFISFVFLQRVCRERSVVRDFDFRYNFFFESSVLLIECGSYIVPRNSSREDHAFIWEEDCLCTSVLCPKKKRVLLGGLINAMPTL